MNGDYDLNEEESALLEHHLDFYQSLDEGRWRPQTPAQEHFVAVCRAQATAETQHERAYIKWKRDNTIRRRERARANEEESQGKIPEFPDGWAKDEFGSREDYKRDRARTWSNNVRNKL